MDRSDKIDQTFDPTAKSGSFDASKDKAMAEASRLGDEAKRIKDDAAAKLGDEAGRVKENAAAVGEDLAKLAREAVSALQRVADDLASRATDRAGEAVETAKGVGLAAVDNVGAIASDAKHRVDSGVETLSQSVARNPITAIAIAAGVGLLFGMMNRSDHRR